MAASVEVGSGWARPQLPLPPLLPSHARRAARGLVVAMLAWFAVLIGRRTGVLDGPVGVVFAVVLVLAVPTSRELPRRVLLGGCLVLGWTQVFWWWPLPVGSVGRVAILLAVLAAGIGAWVASAEHPGCRARRLLPRLRPADLLLALTVAFGSLFTGPWLQAKTPTQTLGMLMLGWDNVAHFSMVHMIRRFGVTVDALPPPQGATWQFAGYPQGFHALTASVVELLIGPGDADTGAELLAYAQGVALVVLAATTMVVAGFCALPAVRRRPGVLVPVAAFVAAVFYLGPGAQAIGEGYANFAFACSLVVAVILLAAQTARVVAPLTLAGIGGALVGIATSWVLMLALALPAVVMLVLPLRRGRWTASEKQLVLATVLVLAVVGCMARTAAVLSHVPAKSPLTIDGGRVAVNVGLVGVAALAIVGMCLVVLRRGRRVTRVRVAAVITAPVVGIATATALVALQVAANGHVTYYGFKFMLGMEIVLLALLPLPLVHLPDWYPRRRATVTDALASVLIALALTQVFGFAGTNLDEFGLGAEADGAKDSARQSTVIADPPSAAELAARVAGLQGRVLPAGAFYLDIPSDGRVSTVLAAQWFLALTDTWTLDANAVASDTVVRDPRQTVAVAVHILESHPGAVVVVRREELDTVRRAVRRPDLMSRIAGL